MVLCGTSGWTRSDWDSVVYPQHKPVGFHGLDFLTRHFDTVEIESTFDCPLRPEIAKLWIRKAAHNPAFVFTAILDRRFTFERSLDRNAAREFKAGIWPLLKAGKLGCLLMRFPWSFRFTGENRSFLIELRRAFHEFPLAAEFRHASWCYDEALGTLMDYRIGFCNIDQPPGARAMQPSAIITSPCGYVRLLGRSGGDWTDDATARDYLYSPLELNQWQVRIERLAAHTERTFVVTANVAGGKSVVNAMQLQKMLREPSSVLKPRAAARTVEITRPVTTSLEQMRLPA